MTEPQQKPVALRELLEAMLGSDAGPLHGWPTRWTEENDL